MSNQLSLSPNVIVVDNKAITTSIDVANYFDKRHNDVLRALRFLDCSVEFSQRNFAQAEYLDYQNKPRPMYRMTKDGFVFLAMGFTGKRAAQFKEAYIEAFNKMERRLSGSINHDETATVNIQALRNLVNNFLWIEEEMKTFRLLDAITMLGGYELAGRLRGRINDSRLAIHLLKANKSLASPCNPR